MSDAERLSSNGPSNACDDAFSRMMRELGIGVPRKPGPRGPDPTPVRVEGRPLSEDLIDERR